MAIPHPESPASPHNPANDLPQYRPPRPIGHGETLPHTPRRPSRSNNGPGRT
ncbi:hypothetical protein Rhow_007806 [Rhodococcus wratislaviensis]|uniref:Uncharacterized protein n=1 Tax=Rhodococcus wratislaviensis TaxID=44752 RepID=A0A402CIX3_RHOWR|nr:hypothetical protein Rhow_007806 [Rhodococcus wratislaviensis]